MSNVSNALSMFLLSVLIMAVLVLIALGFMLGFTHPLPWVLIISLAVIPFLYDKFVSRRLVHWSDSMSVGIEMIDNDHKQLLKILNKLQESTQYKVNDAAVKKSLDELVEYTKYHFQREEALMRLNEYPDFEAHQKAHEEMITNVTQFIHEYEVDKIHAIDHVLLFLKAWLVNHINGTDKKYVPYLKIKTLDGTDQQ